MLILTRKRNESIRIGDDIIVTAVQTHSGSVKIGIQAPNNVKVLRAEKCEVIPATSTPENESVSNRVIKRMIRPRSAVKGANRQEAHS